MRCRILCTERGINFDIFIQFLGECLPRSTVWSCTWLCSEEYLQGSKFVAKDQAQSSTNLTKFKIADIVILILYYSNIQFFRSIKYLFKIVYLKECSTGRVEDVMIINLLKKIINSLVKRLNFYSKKHLNFFNLELWFN